MIRVGKQTFFVRKFQIQKFLCLFRYRKYKNFLDVPIHKLQVLKFSSIICKLQICKVPQKVNFLKRFFLYEFELEYFMLYTKGEKRMYSICGFAEVLILQKSLGLQIHNLQIHKSQKGKGTEDV